MPSVLYRLCEALLPDYEVEREIASGGMGMVFLARDVALDRMVAIKIVRPEMATATATERFLKEARVLANLHHPNAVTIHRAGEAKGFFYYVMDLVQGETLAQRLNRGPLSRAAAVKLGRDVLDALEAVHAMGVVHRDIKPSNIFLTDDRSLLADFGISTASGPQTAPPSGAIAVTGTPGYMPPEQALGGEVTPQTDLYTVGMVLYEALTGRRWEALLPGDPVDWSGVPHGLHAVLKRALAWEPKDRWPDARTFRRALWHTRTTKYRRRTLLLTVSGLAAGALIALAVFGRGRRAAEAEWYDLAILPLEETGATPPGLGGILASLVPASVPASVFTMNAARAAAWWDSAGADAEIAAVPALLRARYVATGAVSVSGDSLRIDLDLVAESGRIQAVTPVHRRLDDGFANIAAAIAHSLTRETAGATEYQPSAVFAGRGDSALSAFVEGEKAFYRNAWNSAIEHYHAAIELNPGFPLASWRQAEAWRWKLEGQPPDVDLVDLVENHMDELGELDYRLIEAQLAPSLRERLARYAQIVTDFPRDGYATFLFGEEMMHRGALIGLPLDSAAALLELATEKAPNLGPAWEALFQVSVRLYRKDAARNALDRFTEVRAPPSELELYAPLYEMLYASVFEPETAESIFTPAALQQLPGLVENFRAASSFGAHEMMAHVAGLILESAGDRATQATAAEARALGLFALGRPAEALQLFDQAALLFGTPEARFQAAEWRVVSAALGVPGIPDAEAERGRGALESFARQPDFAARAAWVLGLDAYARGDLESGDALLDRLRSAADDSMAARLALHLQAAELAARRRWLMAVARSDALLAFDSVGLQHGDPFARAALHLKRADWFDRAGEPAKADSARSWYEHMIWRIRLVNEAEPAEIDWALGAYAEYLRAAAAAERGDQHAACRRFSRVAALWRDPEPAYHPFSQEATERAAGCRK